MGLAHTPTVAGTKRPTKTFIQRSREIGAEEKAIYHNKTGAGKSHVRREFMGLTDDDEAYLTEKLAEGIDRQLAGER